MMWSKLRQKIKEFITPELRDRIDIHCTCYREAHDDHGEVWITLDKEKIFDGGYWHWYMTYMPKELLTEFEIQHGFHRDFYNVEIESKEVENIMKLGVHETSHITQVLGNYINTPIEESLKSNNPIYLAFAIIDRRLGKKRFQEMKLDDNEHPLIKIFYDIRKESFHL